VDTLLESPNDISDTEDGETFPGQEYVVQPRSIVILRVHREEHAPLVAFHENVPGATLPRS
jgi:hypothetical protein